MSTYKELKAQIAALEIQAEQARKAEMSGAKEQIFAIMREFNLTPADIAKVQTAAAKGVSKNPAPVLFRNQETGDTWSGRGREPGWIKGQDREQYRVSANAH